MSEFPILHDNQPTASDLKNQLAEIINDNPVTLETIGTHADDVLTKLITFIDSVTGAYDKQPTINMDLPKDSENAAFEYYELDDIESILDEFVRMKNIIDDLRATIESIQTVTSKVVPSSITSSTSNKKDQEQSESERKRVKVDRVLAVLYILKEKFGIDPSDTATVKLSKDSKTPVRNRYYTYIEVSSPEQDINLTILACNDHGSATFIFNNQAMNEAGYSIDSLRALDNTGRNKLIESNPGIGKRVFFRTRFMDNIEEAIKPRYSRFPRAESSDLNFSQLRKFLKINYYTLSQIIDDLTARGLLTDDIKQFDRSPARSFSKAQQELIRAYMIEKEKIVPIAPETFKPQKTIWEEVRLDDTISVSRPKFDKLMKSIKSGEFPSLGEIRIMKSQGKQLSKSTFFYSPEQVEQIKNLLREMASSSQKIA